MAGITLETAQRMLDVWVAAEESVSHGQSYQIGNRSLTKADLTQIGKRIEYWSNKVTFQAAERLEPDGAFCTPRPVREG